jgi:hypothetical protein
LFMACFFALSPFLLSWTFDDVQHSLIQGFSQKVYCILHFHNLLRFPISLRFTHINLFVSDCAPDSFEEVFRSRFRRQILDDCNSLVTCFSPASHYLSFAAIGLCSAQPINKPLDYTGPFLSFFSTRRVRVSANALSHFEVLQTSCISPFTTHSEQPLICHILQVHDFLILWSLHTDLLLEMLSETLTQSSDFCRTRPSFLMSLKRKADHKCKFHSLSICRGKSAVGVTDELTHPHIHFSPINAAPLGLPFIHVYTWPFVHEKRQQKWEQFFELPLFRIPV